MRTVTRVHLTLATLLTLLALTTAAPSAAGERPKAAAAGTAASSPAVLSMASYVRWHASMKPPQTTDSAGKTTPIKPAIVNYQQAGDALESPVPTEDWAGADFDDSAWPRTRLDWARDLSFGRLSASRVFFRAKFAVTDPGSANLRLSFNYRGGAVVYVNGQELVRGNMPQGKLDPDAPADAYPDEAFLDKAGKAIPSPEKFKNAAADDKKDLEERVAKRGRSLSGVDVPAKLLRKGVNVLAIEVRRAPYHPIAGTWNTPAGVATGARWVTVGLNDLKLEAGGAGATANTSRPAGLQLWNQDRCDRVALCDYGDPNEKLQPVKIFGARNGRFCGQLVLGSTEALTGIAATPSALKGPKGEIPASGVTVLYGKPDMPWYGYQTWFMGLSPKSPGQVAVDKGAGAAMQELLLRVAVPKDAAAGLYKGTVTVAASGKSFEVPIEVNVSDWTLPDPKDYRTYIGAYQSPASVAMQYNVTP
ncbi:MAG TPA: hypothetical protein PK280_15815, partial [Planctomycetota bacterium]|nr:hypothetical protein [Planctomycetota bacterium]